jgi:hypothetical protein
VSDASRKGKSPCRRYHAFDTRDFVNNQHSGNMYHTLAAIHHRPSTTRRVQFEGTCTIYSYTPALLRLGEHTILQQKKSPDVDTRVCSRSAVFISNKTACVSSISALRAQTGLYYWSTLYSLSVNLVTVLSSRQTPKRELQSLTVQYNTIQLTYQNV